MSLRRMKSKLGSKVSKTNMRPITNIINKLGTISGVRSARIVYPKTPTKPAAYKRLEVEFDEDL
jgi:hypothetical protein